jgi:hypothetical protein
MKRAVLIALLALPLFARAQENTFTLDAGYLTRGELRIGGLFSEEGDPLQARFILGRTRLGATYSRSWLTARLTAQHAGTWGSSAGSNLSIYDAWVEMRLPVGFFAKVGRQALAYDDERIFGSDDWSMTGMSHDGLKLGFERWGHKLHLFGAYNQDVDNIEQGGTRFSGGIQPYKSLASVWYHYDIPKTSLGASLLWARIGIQSHDGLMGELEDDTHFQQIAGAFLTWKPAWFGLETAYYRQWGTEQSGLPLNAWMASAKTTAALSSRLAVRSGFDYLSGEENFAAPAAGQLGLVRHEVVQGFNSLYGSNHKFYGAMDFFYVQTYVNGFTPGLQNLYAGITWSPVKELSMDAAYHYLSTAVPVQDAASNALGHEVELAASWKIAGSLSLSAGYSFMQGTETMEILKRSANKNRLQWAWVMLQVTPTFFSHKW